MGKGYDLSEKPDHGHYSACAARKADIEEFSRNVFVYTTGISIVLMFITYMGANIAAVSWIPSLFGDPTDIGHLFSQSFELILFALASFIAYGKRKYLHILIFFAYIIMIVGAVFDGSAVDIITFIIGVIGAILTKDCFSCYTDYRQLTQTEGWPIFNLHLTESDEHSSYESRYASALSKAPADKIEALSHIMAVPKAKAAVSHKPAPLRPEPAVLKTEGVPEMEEMPSIMSICSEEPETPDVDFFEPDSGLYDDTSPIQ